MTSAPPTAGPASVASCVPLDASALPAWSSSPESSEGMIEKDPGRKSPSPAPITTAIGTSTTARAGPVAAVTARAARASARTASVAIITVCGRQRSLAYPPTAISAVRGTP